MDATIAWRGPVAKSLRLHCVRKDKHTVIHKLLKANIYACVITRIQRTMYVWNILSPFTIQDAYIFQTRQVLKISFISFGRSRHWATVGHLYGQLVWMYYDPMIINTCDDFSRCHWFLFMLSVEHETQWGDQIVLVPLSKAISSQEWSTAALFHSNNLLFRYAKESYWASSSKRVSFVKK